MNERLFLLIEVSTVTGYMQCTPLDIDEVRGICAEPGFTESATYIVPLAAYSPGDESRWVVRP